MFAIVFWVLIGLKGRSVFEAERCGVFIGEVYEDDADYHQEEKALVSGLGQVRWEYAARFEHL